MSAAYLVGAVVDDVTTYLYVKTWGVYAEANPLVVALWLDKPLWVWILRDVFGLFLALAASIVLRGLMDFVIGRVERPSPTGMKMLRALRRMWALPLWLATIVRCLPAVHNLLLMTLNVESPLSQAIKQILSPVHFLGTGGHEHLATHPTWAGLQPDSVRTWTRLPGSLIGLPQIAHLAIPLNLAASPLYMVWDAPLADAFGGLRVLPGCGEALQEAPGA